MRTTENFFEAVGRCSIVSKRVDFRDNWYVACRIAYGGVRRLPR